MRCRSAAVPLGVLVLAALQVQPGCSIKCYTCSSKTNEACMKFDRNKIPLKHCDHLEANSTEKNAEAIYRKYGELFHLDLAHQDPLVPMNCLKQITKVGEQEIVLRGCQLAATEQLDICFKVKELDNDLVRTKYCSLCNSDACNGGNNVWRPYSLAFLIAALTAFV